jgi:hypothetical protein
MLAMPAKKGLLDDLDDSDDDFKKPTKTTA